MTATKTCKACHVEKPLDDFYSTAQPNRYQPRCKECVKAQQRFRYANDAEYRARQFQYHAAHRAKGNGYAAAYYQRNRERILARQQEYRALNRERLRLRQLAFRKRHREVLRAKAMDYRAGKQPRLQNSTVDHERNSNMGKVIKLPTKQSHGGYRQGMKVPPSIVALLMENPKAEFHIFADPLSNVIVGAVRKDLLIAYVEALLQGAA